VPTLVIHGLQDRVVTPSGGLALAKAIPGARLLGFAGMGHNLPRPLWPQVVNELDNHFGSATNT
jgi:pimeloyl-ACP methyl ester carboxylesterase